MVSAKMGSRYLSNRSEAIMFRISDGIIVNRQVTAGSFAYKVSSAANSHNK